MAADDGVRLAWVRRVLGVAVAEVGGADRAGGGSEAKAALARAGAVWRAASEAVHGQIAALRAVLGKSGDDALEEIADFSLADLTEGREARLAAALGGGAAVAAGSPLLGVIDEFAAFVEHSEKIEVCDENPFGVAMSIRGTLGGAFETMREALVQDTGGAGAS